MQTSKMLLGVALLSLAVASVLAETVDCTDDYCKHKQCEEPEDCEGSVVTGKCGCCKECAKVEGEFCDGDPDEGTCDKGLICAEGWPYGKCRDPKE